MSPASRQAPNKSATLPIQGTWDWLSLLATRTQNAGNPVAANELDADLHIETTTIMFADVVEKTWKFYDQREPQIGIVPVFFVDSIFQLTIGGATMDIGRVPRIRVAQARADFVKLSTFVAD